MIWGEICISKSSRFDHGHGTVYRLKKRGNNVAAAVVAPSGSWRLIGSLTSFRSRKEGVLVFVRLQRESPRETPSRQSVRRSLRPPRVLVGRSPIVFEIVGVLFYKKHGNSSHHSHPTKRASALFSQHPPIPPWGSARTRLEPVSNLQMSHFRPRRRIQIKHMANLSGGPQSMGLHTGIASVLIVTGDG